MVLKSPAEIAIMHEANLIIRRILDVLRELVRPGMTTAEIDAYAEERIRAAGATPAFKGYPHRGDGRDFPGTVCASVNDEVVHGVPSSRVTLKDGDIVSVDLGVLYKGYYGDSAETYAVGTIDKDAEQLLKITKESLARAVEQARPETGCPISAMPCSSTSRPTASRSCASSLVMGSDPSCTRTRRYRTSDSPVGVSVWFPGWCWRSNRWSTPAVRRSCSAPKTAGRRERATGVFLLTSN